MIIRNNDGGNDWTWGHGKQDYLTGDRAIMLNVKTRLFSFLNDCFWQLPFGIDWWNLLGQKNPQAQVAIMLQTRTMLAGSYGIVRINSVEPSIDTRTRLLTVRFDVQTIYSRSLQDSVTITP